MKEKIDVHKLNSYNFDWSLAKSLAMSHTAQRNINGIGMMVQLKEKSFLGTALIESKPQPKIENKYESTGKRKKNVKYIRTKEIRNPASQSTEQCH